MNNNKAVLLDRDGVINIDCGFTYKIENFRFEKNAVKGMEMLKKNGFKLIIITSQSGIGRGYFTEEDMGRFNKHLLDELRKKEIRIEKIYYCPHKPEDNCSCRKPRTDLIERAIKEFDINRKMCFMIGDETKDIITGENAHIKAIIVKTGKAGNDRLFNVKPAYVAEDLVDAANWIMNQ